MFLELKLEDDDRGHEPLNINLSQVVDFRAFKTPDSKNEKTVFFFTKESGKSKVVANVSVKKIQKILGVLRIEDYE